MMRPVAILASGMVTAVGVDTPSSCAALRSAIDKFSETGFRDAGGEWIIGGQVPLDARVRGSRKLVRMVAHAIRECVAQVRTLNPERTPLLLGVSEKERPGRIGGLDDEILANIQRELGMRFHERSAIFPHGRVAGALALVEARRLLYEEHHPYCLVAGVDTFLVSATLAAYEERDRLLTSTNSNGFIPGEAGTAIIVGVGGNGKSETRSETVRGGELSCIGIGLGQETATIESERPLRGDGMVQAFKAAFADAQATLADVQYRITDSNGEQYWFKEDGLAVTRTVRTTKDDFDIWHPADCLGEIGAAAAPCGLGIALVAARKHYAPGPGVLCHFSAEGSERVALVLRNSAARTI
jgi:3-oxoacyl-[acyl-carrier-protein] synthase-1